MRIAPEPRPVASPSPRSWRSLRTARYSRIRSFTSCRPSWSASSTTRASAMSRLSSVRTFHGISIIQSRYVRIQPCSGDCSEVRSRRPSSRRASFSTSSGMPASAIFLRYSSTTFSSPSSPSSLRIALICSRSRNSRWRFSMPSLTSVRIFSFSSRSASTSLDQREHDLQALLDVDRLEHLHLLLEREVGRVAAGVGDRAGVEIPRRNSATPGTPRASTMFSMTARYSRASWVARSVAAGSSTGSTWTHVARPVPGTPSPTIARCRPRMTSASVPLRRRPTSSTWATVPMRA